MSALRTILTLAALLGIAHPGRADDDYAAKRARAVREKKCLVVWTDGFVCPPCEAALNDCVHYHCPGEFYGVKTGVVVGVYKDGNLWRYDLHGDRSVRSIAALVRPQAVLSYPVRP